MQEVTPRLDAAHQQEIFDYAQAMCHLHKVEVPPTFKTLGTIQCAWAHWEHLWRTAPTAKSVVKATSVGQEAQLIEGSTTFSTTYFLAKLQFEEELSHRIIEQAASRYRTDKLTLDEIDEFWKTTVLNHTPAPSEEFIFRVLRKIAIELSPLCKDSFITISSDADIESARWLSTQGYPLTVAGIATSKDFLRITQGRKNGKDLNFEELSIPTATLLDYLNAQKCKTSVSYNCSSKKYEVRCSPYQVRQLNFIWPKATEISSEAYHDMQTLMDGFSPEVNFSVYFNDRTFNSSIQWRNPRLMYVEVSGSVLSFKDVKCLHQALAQKSRHVVLKHCGVRHTGEIETKHMLWVTDKRLLFVGEIFTKTEQAEYTALSEKLHRVLVPRLEKGTLSYDELNDKKMCSLISALAATKGSYNAEALGKLAAIVAVLKDPSRVVVNNQDDVDAVKWVLDNTRQVVTVGFNPNYYSQYSDVNHVSFDTQSFTEANLDSLMRLPPNQLRTLRLEGCEIETIGEAMRDRFFEFVHSREITLEAGARIKFLYEEYLDGQRIKQLIQKYQTGTLRYEDLYADKFEEIIRAWIEFPKNIPYGVDRTVLNILHWIFKLLPNIKLYNNFGFHLPGHLTSSISYDDEWMGISTWLCQALETVPVICVCGDLTKPENLTVLNKFLGSITRPFSLGFSRLGLCHDTFVPGVDLSNPNLHDLRFEALNFSAEAVATLRQTKHLRKFSMDRCKFGATSAETDCVEAVLESSPSVEITLTDDKGVKKHWDVMLELVETLYKQDRKQGDALLIKIFARMVSSKFQFNSECLAFIRKMLYQCIDINSSDSSEKLFLIMHHVFLNLAKSYMAKPAGDEKTEREILSYLNSISASEGEIYCSAQEYIKQLFLMKVLRIVPNDAFFLDELKAVAAKESMKEVVRYVDALCEQSATRLREKDWEKELGLLCADMHLYIYDPMANASAPSLEETKRSEVDELYDQVGRKIRASAPSLEESKQGEAEQLDAQIGNNTRAVPNAPSLIQLKEDEVAQLEARIGERDRHVAPQFQLPPEGYVAVPSAYEIAVAPVPYGTETSSANTAAAVRRRDAQPVLRGDDLVAQLPDVPEGRPVARAPAVEAKRNTGRQLERAYK
ncbi:MAG TPA: hypothetical protein VGV92_04990 [Gammaproteobacteria bacterium]|nr:hypothetical protein [Gammaproteobacteria bacterium]